MQVVCAIKGIDTYENRRRGSREGKHAQENEKERGKEESKNEQEEQVEVEIKMKRKREVANLAVMDRPLYSKASKLSYANG